jgi:hypothetical protein
LPKPSVFLVLQDPDMTEPHDVSHGIQEGHGEGATHGHSLAGHSASDILSEEEFRQLQRSDLGAGKVVVSLMAGIFTTGLLLYATILILILS